MKKTIQKSMLLAGAALLALPAAALADGIIGQCADCHTMHNSQQNQPVAVRGVGGLVSAPNGIQNLLKMDCVACHAQNSLGEKIAVIGGGSKVPQVYHGDTSDLAAGNFIHIVGGNDRRGHNVKDLFPAGDESYDGFNRPPGLPDGGEENLHHNMFGANFAGFTCAGAMGCHGTRHQTLPGGANRDGFAAISGAHHNNADGAKLDVAQVVAGVHDGEKVAESYRFILGLKGTGSASPDRWQNAEGNHNRYYGDATALGTGCNTCHLEETGGDRTTTSALKVPNQSMSGFCATCHGNFHSSGGSGGDIVYNGVSGAFLRHPSDYILPTGDEYAGYGDYNLTAPVAFNAGGEKVVMCLSCHQAHATPNDGMLRFNYALMIAGQATHGEGCLGCHTTKGAKP
jgi:hypothetical protein